MRLRILSSISDLDSSNVFIWTETFNCGKIGRLAVASFLAHHSADVNVFGFREDLDWIPDDPRVRKVAFRQGPMDRFASGIWRHLRIGPPVLDELTLRKGFGQGHLGTARLWAYLMRARRESFMVHFDSDVIFLGPVVDDIVQRSVSADLVGPVRHYAKNPSGVVGVSRLDDVVGTYCFGFRPKLVKNHRYTKLVKMIQGLRNPLGHPIIDFFDPVSFEILSTGGRISLLDPDLVGGMTRGGDRQNRHARLNDYPTPFKIDFGSQLIHFSAAGSGMNAVTNKAAQLPNAYKRYAVDRYALYCKAFYDEDLGVPLDSYQDLLAGLAAIDRQSWLLRELP